YDASQAVNWRVEQVNGKTRLAQITFREITNESAGQFAEKEVIRYRVLRPGSWELWRETDTGSQRTWIMEDAGVSTLPEIPVAAHLWPKNRLSDIAPAARSGLDQLGSLSEIFRLFGLPPPRQPSDSLVSWPGCEPED
ncbi:MAG: hypothetical protein IPM55_22135, partial [Acidobacteria bacterium]|nr:hypothetical protein [Acidobacteriota bacterium]